MGPKEPNLFIISSDKPDIPNCEYLTLNDPNDDRSLTVVPPLPFQHRLYLLVTPRIWCKFVDSAAFERLVEVELYQLSPLSFGRFRKAVEKAGPSIPGVRETANGEEPPPKWDTWCVCSRRESPGMLMVRKYVPLEFYLVPFKVLQENLATNVFKQIANVLVPGYI